MTKDLLKLKISLIEAIDEWIEKECDHQGWAALETYVGYGITELMADSAFNILLSQSDLTKYLEKQNYLK